MSAVRFMFHSSSFYFIRSTSYCIALFHPCSILPIYDAAQATLVLTFKSSHFPCRTSSLSSAVSTNNSSKPRHNCWSFTTKAMPIDAPRIWFPNDHGASRAIIVRRYRRLHVLGEHSPVLPPRRSETNRTQPSKARILELIVEFETLSFLLLTSWTRITRIRIKQGQCNSICPWFWYFWSLSSMFCVRFA